MEDAGDRAEPSFDSTFWEERWSEVLEQHGEQLSQRPPSSYLTAAAERLAPGRALDAGCGPAGPVVSRPGGAPR